MFHADHSAIAVAAHLLVAFLFIWTGIYNASSVERTRQRTEVFAKLGLPFPRLILWTGYVLQWTGGVMVLIDWHAGIGAVLLIAFTLAAEITFHNYWAMTDPLRRAYHRLLFLNNCGVLGGLLLIAEPALLGL